MSAALAHQDLIWSSSKLLTMTQVDFAGLSLEPWHEVTARYTLGRRVLSDANRFYEQSGALVFFLMNAAGEGVAGRLIELMRVYYQGNPPAEPWNFLGFDSSAGLDSSFRAFLDAL